MKEALEILFDKFGIKKKTIRDQNAEFFFFILFNDIHVVKYYFNCTNDDQEFVNFKQMLSFRIHLSITINGCYKSFSHKYL